MKTVQNDIKWSSEGQIGAKHLLNTFLTTGQGQTMPHAFLFLGPKGIGKKSLASEFIDKIFQSLDSKPEVLEFDFAEGSGVETLRELISFSSLTSIGAKKVFLLKNFHLANPSSSNSLLKTLEEPSASSMFVLISDGNTALPTVMSRCIVVRCFPSNNSEQLVSTPENISALLSRYPELNKQLLEFPESLDELSIYFENLKSRDLSLIAKLSNLESDQLNLLLQLWMEYLRENLHSNKDLEKTISNIKVAAQTKNDLGRSYNTKLVLQQFLLETKV